MLDPSQGAKTELERYERAVLHVLGGFQLIEAHLKDNIEYYYIAVRRVLGNQLPFKYSRDDIEKLPLGKLISLFSKIGGDPALVAKMRSIIHSRNQAAHRALICIYEPTKPSPELLIKMVNDNYSLGEEISAVLESIGTHRRMIADFQPS